MPICWWVDLQTNFRTGKVFTWQVNPLAEAFPENLAQRNRRVDEDHLDEDDQAQKDPVELVDPDQEID